MAPPFEDQILVVHLGGLGDVCLSESTFLSLVQHFGQKLVAVGYTRFLGLFPDYFSAIHSIDSREWLYLFTNGPERSKWKRIILIGKDRIGDFRNRLAKLSREGFLFIDMYPDLSKIHVQDYQLDQLESSEIRPIEKPTPSKLGDKIVLYPERGYTKQKWPYEKFREVYDRLRKQGYSASLLEPFDTGTRYPGSFRFDQLTDVKAFLLQSDVFISNDCGIAHLAASLGLSTITLFYEADPVIWHPLGDNRPLRCVPSPPSVEELLTIIKSASRKQ